MKTILFVGGARAAASYEKASKFLDQLIGDESVGVCLLKDFETQSINQILKSELREGQPWRAIVIADLTQDNLRDSIISARTVQEVREEAARDDSLDASALINPDDARRSDLLLHCYKHLTEGSASFAKAHGVELAEGEGELHVDMQTPYPLPRYVNNPFDFVWNLGLIDFPEEIRHPFVQLLQLLSGMPAHIMNPGCPGVDSWTRNKVFGDLIRGMAKDEKGQQRLAILDNGISRKELGDSEEYGVDRSDAYEAYRQIRRQLQKDCDQLVSDKFPESTAEDYTLEELKLEHQRPSSVMAITFRTAVRNSPDRIAEEPPNAFGSLYSEFCLRNHYPDQTRFLVWDIEEHDMSLVGRGKTVSEQEVGFWMAIATLALEENAFVARTLSAYTLNALSLDMDFEAFKERLREKWSLAHSAKALLDHRISTLEDELLPDLEEKRALPDTQVRINVDLSDAKAGVCEVDVDRYGWLKDSQKPYPIERGTLEERAATLHPPRHGASDGAKNFFFGIGSIPRRMRNMPPMDEARFGEDFNKVDVGMTTLLRAPRRALAIAAERFRKEKPFDEDVLTSFRINQYDTIDLEEDLCKEELDLASDCSLSALSSDAYRLRQEKLAALVKKRMKPRAYLHEVVRVLVLLGAVSLVAFLPFVLGLTGGEHVNGYALLVSLGAVALVLIAGFIPLKMSHFEVKGRIRRFNEGIEMLSQDLTNKARSIGDRISRYGTYRKKYSLLEAQHSDTKPYTRALAKMYKQRRDLNELLDGYGSDSGFFFGQSPRPDEPQFDSWESAEDALSQVGYFEICPDFLRHARPFNQSLHSGKSVVVPYDFITSLEAKRISLVDPRVVGLSEPADFVLGNRDTAEAVISTIATGAPLPEQLQDSSGRMKLEAWDATSKLAQFESAGAASRYDKTPGRAAIEPSAEERHGDSANQQKEAGNE